MSARRVMIASSDTLFRDALESFFGRQEGWECAGVFADGLAAVGAVARRQPDVLLATTDLARLGAGAVARKIARRWPGVAVVILGDVDVPDATVLPWRSPSNEVLAALGAARSVAPTRDGDRGPDAVAALQTLTKRERFVLKRLAEGHEMGGIARELDVSEHTVRTHMQNLYAKLGAHSRLEVVRFAIGHGIVSAANESPPP